MRANPRIGIRPLSTLTTWENTHTLRQARRPSPLSFDSIHIHTEHGLEMVVSTACAGLARPLASRDVHMQPQTPNPPCARRIAVAAVQAQNPAAPVRASRGWVLRDQ